MRPFCFVAALLTCSGHICLEGDAGRFSFAPYSVWSCSQSNIRFYFRVRSPNPTLAELAEMARKWRLIRASISFRRCRIQRKSTRFGRDYDILC